MKIKPLLIGIVVVLAIGAYFGYKKLSLKSVAASYQTAKAEKGTLIISVSASGNVSTANSAVVNTQTSGVVNKVYVKNGDTVKSGDPIADVDLDMDGKQRSAQALASYQSAKNSLASAQANFYSLQSSMFTKWQTFMDIAQNSTFQNADKTPNVDQRNTSQFIIPNDDWLATEAQYKNQQGVVAQAQTSVNSAWAAYQQTSPTIYAPISGTISGLSLQIGSVLTAQTSSTGNSTSQRIANIKTVATPTVTVNLTQIDAPNVKPDNKATLTMDALADKMFTGKVVSIDTTGAVSSGVTTYPAVIQLDTASDDIFPNMTSQASIITNVKNDVLLVPVASVQTKNGNSYVRVLKNGAATQVDVQTGLSSATQIEITSGLAEGDEVITSIIQPTTQSTSQSSSPFSAFGGANRGFGGGNAVHFRGN